MALAQIIPGIDSESLYQLNKPLKLWVLGSTQQPSFVPVPGSGYADLYSIKFVVGKVNHSEMKKVSAS